MKVTVFWDTGTFSLVKVDAVRMSEKSVYFKRLHSGISQIAVMFIYIALATVSVIK
jgi:hypothetical protein